MKFRTNTYRTLTGKHEVLEISDKKYHQKVILKDNKPAYLLDFYNLHEESNAMMNSLVLCTDNSLEKVLTKINRLNNINLTVQKPIKFRFQKKIKSEIINVNLQPIPKEWLRYSL